MIGQHFMMKSILKPSGPGDLSEGRSATTLSISSSVKGASNDDKSGWGVRIESKFRGMEMLSDWPNLSLYASQRICSFSRWFECITPEGFSRHVIKFFLCLMVAFAWKKLGTSISFRDPSYRPPLFPVNFFLLQEKNKSILEYRSKVPFLQGEISEFFQNPQEGKHKFYILNIGF